MFHSVLCHACFPSNTLLKVIYRQCVIWIYDVRVCVDITILKFLNCVYKDFKLCCTYLLRRQFFFGGGEVLHIIKLATSGYGKTLTFLYWITRKQESSLVVSSSELTWNKLIFFLCVRFKNKHIDETFTCSMVHIYIQFHQTRNLLNFCAW